MLMFIKLFLVSCIMAHPQGNVQPLPNGLKVSTVDHNVTIFSLIKCTGHSTAYENLKSEQNFRQLEGYCERPLPDTPSADTYISYEVILCMALYDAVQHVCDLGHTEVSSISGDFSCDTMIKEVPEACDEHTEPWVKLFKAKFGNISVCEGQCMQGQMISPICEYIWKANTLAAQVPAEIGADISSAKNSHVTLKGPGKTNKKMMNQNKPSEAKASDPPSAARPHHPIMNNGSQNTEQVDHEMTPTNEFALHKEAKGNSTQSGSENVVKNNGKEQAHTIDSNVQVDSKNQTQATINAVHTDDKKLTHGAGSNTQNYTNKEAYGTHHNLQNIAKEQVHPINSSSPSAKVTLSAHTEGTPEADKHDDSTGKSLSESKSNTAPQAESAGAASDQDVGNKNDDDEDTGFATVENNDKMQGTDGTGDNPDDFVDQEKGKLHSDHQEEQSDQTPQRTGTQQEDAATSSTAQFNELGDVAGSHFYPYFMTMVVICIVGYLVFHNKQKILALALEGRSRRGTRRRPNTSAYRKLDSNLEEAVTSACSTSVTHVIY